MGIYLDHNASTPVDERVAEAMLAVLRAGQGNPSSVHGPGRAARAAIEQAREQVAALVGAAPGQVVFTSGGTEANNLALHAVLADAPPGRLVVSAIEHASLLEAAEGWSRRGCSLERAGVDGSGRVTPEHLAAVLTPDTRLVSVMMANNETGAVQDIAPLASMARDAGAVFHTDAIQAAGKLPVDFGASGAQLMSLSAHKLYGPKGVGALVVDRSVELVPQLYGGSQEKGLRAGTENVAGIVGFGLAAELALQALDSRRRQARRLRERLEAGLAGLPGVTVFAATAERLPNTTQFAVAGIDGEALLMQLDKDGIAVSSGSACTSGSTETSHVLTAMGVDEETARGAIRVSVGRDNTEADVDALLASLRRRIEWLQKASRAAGW